MTSFVAPASAGEANISNDSVSALRDYAQLVDVARKPSGALDQSSDNPAPKETADATIAALRIFAQQIGSNQSESIKGLPKLADADNLLDFLRERGSSTPPSAAPKGSSKGNGPVAGGTKSSAPVEASFVGAKVCVTCHATQADSFSHTLMGRIGKTQKGKFDCENCHGPGSAHVKAGGGRGVGGIISFRPEDQSRTAEENNAICLTCHQRGDRTYWSGSTHETRGLMCTNCHTVMKQVSRKIQIEDSVRARHLLPVPQGPARADVPLVAHAAARRQDGVLGLPQSARQRHRGDAAARIRSTTLATSATPKSAGRSCSNTRRCARTALNCHDPHGSVNEYMLKISRPRLCTECHAFGHGGNVSGPLVVQAIGRSCQNCHTEVHGTNSPSGALLHR